MCPNCGTHHRLTAYERIHALLDEESFTEWDPSMETTNPLNFPEYEEKLRKDQAKTGLKDAVVTGKGTINGYETAIVVMDRSLEWRVWVRLLVRRLRVR